MVGITATGYRILQDIGLNGSSTGYAISKRRNRVTEKTAYTLLPRLVKEGLLSVEVIGRTRSGLKKKEYSLTLAGVCHLLLSHSRKKPPRNLLYIIKHWGYFLPHVLGIWEVLQNTIEENTLDTALDEASYEIAFWRRNPHMNYNFVPEEYSKSDLDAFMYKFYWRIFYESKKTNHLLKKIQNQELRVFLTDLIQHFIDLYRSQTAKFEVFLQGLS